MLSGEILTQIGPWIGYALGLLALLALVWVSFDLAPADTRFNVLLLVSGGLIGWVIGVVATMGPVERADYSSYGTAVATFIAGFVLAKLDRVFELSFRERGEIDASVVGRALLFVGGMALGILFMVAWRAYVR
jgi:hypothetical protein